MARKYNIKHFYDIVDRSDFRANPDYKGVCHIAMAQEGHCLPGNQSINQSVSQSVNQSINQSIAQSHISSLVLGVCPRRSCISFLHDSLS